MLNEESRRYFTRAYLVSGTVSPLKLRTGNHLLDVQKCLDFNGTHTKLLDYMKTASISTLDKCRNLTGTLFIQRPNAPGAFITKTPDEIYNSDSAPVMDAMFTFTSQVKIHSNYGKVKHIQLTQFWVWFFFASGIHKSITKCNQVEVSNSWWLEDIFTIFITVRRLHCICIS